MGVFQKVSDSQRTAGESHSQRESLIHSRKALFTAGETHSQRERLIHSGRALFAAGEARAQGETVLRPGKRPVRGKTPRSGGGSRSGAQDVRCREIGSGAAAHQQAHPLTPFRRSRMSPAGRRCHRTLGDQLTCDP